jgi:hypothetical protein
VAYDIVSAQLATLQTGLAKRCFGQAWRAGCDAANLTPTESVLATVQDAYLIGAAL